MAEFQASQTMAASQSNLTASEIITRI